VPARAAAAAAVARKIATLPSHERVSLSDGVGSIYATRPRGEPPEKLEEVFYEDVWYFRISCVCEFQCFLMLQNSEMTFSLGRV